MTINEIRKKYHGKLDALDLELIIAHEIGKTREFVLAHPEYDIPKFQISNFKFQIARRSRSEPLAYILGHKEFFGLDFKVNRHTLVPRPETEMLIDLATRNLKHETKNKFHKIAVIDIGTGSGNIIISFVKKILSNGFQVSSFQFYGTDISPEALKIAKQNAKLHRVDKKIKFIQSNLLSNRKIFNNLTIQQFNNLIITANLPYLSEKIYNSTSRDVKNFEPKSALFSPQNGLGHYTKLLKQIRKLKKDCSMFNVSCFMEISPEQKPALEKLVKSILPGAKAKFIKDLAGKWRVVHISF